MITFQAQAHLFQMILISYIIISISKAILGAFVGSWYYSQAFVSN